MGPNPLMCPTADPDADAPPPRGLDDMDRLWDEARQHDMHFPGDDDDPFGFVVRVA